MIKVQKTIGDRDLIIETGRFAKQADGAVYVLTGNTDSGAIPIAGDDRLIRVTPAR